MSFEPDYKNYSTADLEEAMVSIDRQRYPERFKTIESELLKRKPVVINEESPNQERSIEKESVSIVSKTEDNNYQHSIDITMGYLRKYTLLRLLLIVLAVWQSYDLCTAIENGYIVKNFSRYSSESSVYSTRVTGLAMTAVICFIGALYPYSWNEKDKGGYDDSKK